MIVAAAVAAGLAGAAHAQMGMEDPFGDATVSRADAEKSADARFDKIDANHDGAVTAEEMAATPEGRMRRGRGLGRADADGDGKLTKAEFQAALMRRFDMADADHDGQLTKAERDDARAQMMARFMQRGGGNSQGSGGSEGQ
jgi:Ca2+-binding EF-hand superfamily protein